MIPKTTTYKQFKEKKAKEAARQGGVEKGQRTLNGTDAATSKTNGTLRQDTIANEDAKPSPTAPRTPAATMASVPVSALIADRTVEPTVASHDPDVEMRD